MNKTDRIQLRGRLEALRGWAGQAQKVKTSREDIRLAAESARAEIAARSLAIRIESDDINLVPVDVNADGALAARLVAPRELLVLSEFDELALTIDSPEVEAILTSAERIAKRKLFMGSAARAAAMTDAQLVASMHARATAEGLGPHLASLMPQANEEGASVDIQAFGMVAVGTDFGSIPFRRLDAARSGLRKLQDLRETSNAASRAVTETGQKLRDRDVWRSLSEMPLDALKTATSGRLRLGVIERAGVTTVLDAIQQGSMLPLIEGVGEQTARQVRAAAETMQSMVLRETPVRIDVKRRDDDTRVLLTQLRVWAQAGEVLRKCEPTLDLSQRIQPMLKWAPTAACPQPSHFLTVSKAEAETVKTALREVEALQDAASQVKAGQGDVWSDFLARPADYFGGGSLCGFLSEVAAAAEGQLSKGLVERVRAQELNTSKLRNVSLRGYQDFGARFAIVQRKVVIGDEMGLGKTIEAMAFLGHLHAHGATRSMVICPASVLSNWTRELNDRTDLKVHVLHGGERWSGLKMWERQGGVAVTTFSTLRSLQADTVDLAVEAVVVDEGHLIKNPHAKRTVQTRALIDRADHALLLTGTPIENKLEEFENLVSYLQPDLLANLDTYTPMSFPKLIAPAYLRRNQEDVLTELPERIDVEEWVSMSREDEGSYVSAVAAGNFMGMRRAALRSATSTKLERLLEIVAEARANHRKVIIFSYFRDVLDLLAQQIDGPLFGPLTGSVPAGLRQKMVDSFTAAEPGAVFISQIVAGGVGLNIQAGSVVVITEPQVKPSMETQAVARAHRMGQTETVQVHRLLSNEGVDRRMVEILARKQALFDEFARVSHTADSAPEAIDISEAELAREVIAAERQRLAQRVTATQVEPLIEEERA